VIPGRCALDSARLAGRTRSPRPSKRHWEWPQPRREAADGVQTPRPRPQTATSHLGASTRSAQWSRWRHHIARSDTLIARQLMRVGSLLKIEFASLSGRQLESLTQNFTWRTWALAR
jgi:hypothetical protein